MKISQTSSNKRGFTLIEILVVIAIIAALGGLSYGPIMKYLTLADVTEAQKVCKDLTFAVDNFEIEYTHLPYTGTNYPTSDAAIETSTSAFLDVLMGEDTDINDKAKKFFEASEAKSGKNGLVYDGGSVDKLVDKWAKPFTIMLDYDDNGIVDATDIGTGAAYKKELRINGSIAASAGPDGEYNDALDAKSW